MYVPIIVSIYGFVSIAMAGCVTVVGVFIGAISPCVPIMQPLGVCVGGWKTSSISTKQQLDSACHATYIYTLFGSSYRIKIMTMRLAYFVCVLGPCMHRYIMPIQTMSQLLAHA